MQDSTDHATGSPKSPAHAPPEPPRPLSKKCGSNGFYTVALEVVNDAEGVYCYGPVMCTSEGQLEIIHFDR